MQFFMDQVLRALPFLRNKLGGRGQGKDIVAVPPAYSDLAIQIAAEFKTFLLPSTSNGPGHQGHNRSPPRLTRLLRKSLACPNKGKHMLYRTLPLAGTFMLCLGSAGYAHARLETSDPKNGVVLHTPPPSLTLTFCDGLERAFSRVSLTDATGSNIELKTNGGRWRRRQSLICRARNTSLARQLQSRVACVVERWASDVRHAHISDDAVAPGNALILDRFLLDTALATVWGGGGLVLLAADGARERLSELMRLAFGLAASLAAAAAAAAFPIQTAAIAGGWAAARRFDLIATVASQTQVGISLTAQAVTSTGMLLAIGGRHYRAAVGPAGLALCELAIRGHASADFSLAALVRALVDAVHVLSSAAWVGALLPVILLVRLSRIPDPQRGAVMSMARFSRLGHAAVAMVLTSGAVNTWLIL